MRTVQSHSAAKESLLEAARQLMLGKGYPATTIDEICALAGVTKGCFFYYFADKEQLGKELIERAAGEQKQNFENAPFRREKDPLKRVYAFVDAFIRKSQEKNSHRSCLLGTFAQELSETYPAIRAACEKSFSDWADVLNDDLTEAKKMYMPHSSLDTKALAYYFISLLEGSLILAKAQKSFTVPAENFKLFKDYLKRIFPQVKP